jgi:hypothetical protein
MKIRIIRLRSYSFEFDDVQNMRLTAIGAPLSAAMILRLPILCKKHKP